MKYRTILMFGAPGSGKGTHGRALGAIPNFFHCACGDVFRNLRPDTRTWENFHRAHQQGFARPGRADHRIVAQLH